MALSKAQLAEWAKALDSVKAAKNLFWAIIGLSILIQIGAFVAVNSFDVITPVVYSDADTQPTTAEGAGKTGGTILDSLEDEDAGNTDE